MNKKKLPMSRVLNIPDLLHVSGFIDVPMIDASSSSCVLFPDSLLLCLG